MAKISSVDLFKVPPRWLFLKISTDEGIASRVHRSMARMLMKELEPYRLMFVEEPVLPENMEVLAEIRRHNTVPIATGERIYTRWGFQGAAAWWRGGHNPAGCQPLRRDLGAAQDSDHGRSLRCGGSTSLSSGTHRPGIVSPDRFLHRKCRHSGTALTSTITREPISSITLNVPPYSRTVKAMWIYPSVPVWA